MQLAPTHHTGGVTTMGKASIVDGTNKRHNIFVNEKGNEMGKEGNILTDTLHEY